MKISLTVVALLLLLWIGVQVAVGQRGTCSCEKVPDDSCHGIVTCPGGCTALCGSNDACYLSCRSDLLHTRISEKFVKKEGGEIASVLSDRTHKKIEFTPYPRNLHARYDLEIKDDDIWNALNFLYKRGNVKIGGLDFGKLRELRREMRLGKQVSVNFIGIPAKDVVAKLAFLSGRSFRVKSGDPEKLVSISLQQVTLDEVISRVSASAGVKIKK